MKNLKRTFGFIILVVILAMTMTPLIIRVQGTSTFQGTVEDCSSNPLSGASVVLTDCYFNILGLDTTDSSGYYRIDVTLNGNSPYYLTVLKTRFTTQMKSANGPGTTNFDLVGITEKIAVFFWASDAGLEDVIDDYIDILEDQDYTKFYNFEDSSNVASDCSTVDAYEHDQDTIFVYIIGHGNNDGDNSYTAFKPNDSIVYSNTFRNYMNQWEAPRKCLLVESCYAGDWADDFASTPYLAMATSDEDHPAVSYNNHDLPWEGKFSHHFFAQIQYYGKTAVEAFNCAKSLCSDQYPKKSDFSSYEWFGN